MDDSIILEGPRYRRLILPVAAVIVPVVIFVGASAWFIRAFVAPPMVQIADTPPATSSPPAPQVVQAEPPAAELAEAPPAPTMTRQSAPPVVARPSAMLASLAFVPPSLPQPQRPALNSEPAIPPDAAAEETAPREPIAGPIPLPVPRPRIASAIVRGAVPLPRPRPQSEQPPLFGLFQ